MRTHYSVLHADTHTNTQTQVGLRSLVCQFVVPLVPSQEAHRQASSHAWTGTGPHTNTVVPAATVQRVCVCVLTFLTGDMLKNWEHVKKQRSHFHGKWNSSHMCVWLWCTLHSQRERLCFDFFTRLWQRQCHIGLNLIK